MSLRSSSSIMAKTTRRESFTAIALCPLLNLPSRAGGVVPARRSRVPQEDVIQRWLRGRNSHDGDSPASEYIHDAGQRGFCVLDGHVKHGFSNNDAGHVLQTSYPTQRMRIDAVIGQADFDELTSK